MFPPVLVLAAVAAGAALGAAALASARWPYRSPAAAILLWQALGLSWGLAAVGALAALGAVPGRHGVAGGALSSAARAVRSAALGFGRPALIAAARLAVLAASATLLALLCWVLVAASAATAARTRTGGNTCGQS